MKIVTALQMKEIENNFMKETGIPSLILMENAANAVALEIAGKKGIKKICVVCSKGNNGGDGFAAARLLSTRNYDVKIIFHGEKDRATPDCRTNIDFAEKIGIEIIPSYEEQKAEDALNNCDCIVDALIGTGLSKELREDVKKLVVKINNAQKYVVSIDCPTGANSDNGNIISECVRANKTVTFYMPKAGLFLYPTAEYAGEVITANISIPHSEIKKYNIKFNTLTEEEASNMVPERKANSHKGIFGKVGIFAGSENMPGAAVICTRAAYKSGCGLVYAFSGKSVSSVINTKIPETVTINLITEEGALSRASFEDIDMNTFEKLDAVAVGCGIGKTAKTAEFLRELLKAAKTNLILDADALNIISEDMSMLQTIRCPFAVTPHIAEMSRLTGKSIQYISNNMIETASDFAKKYNAVTVLKSARTVIASPEGEIYINATGNSSLSKGGSGDMLTGTITSLAAQMNDIFKACILGCFINGKAAEKAGKRFGEFGTTTENISFYISDILSRLKR